MCVGVDSGPLAQRRATVVGATGFDYSSIYQIENDILTRIRALLLSRHQHNPPATPWHSPEGTAQYKSLYDDIARFDFSTAKSVASAAREASSRLSLPSNNAVTTLPQKGTMDVSMFNRPANMPTRKATLRSSTSSEPSVVWRPLLDGTSSFETVAAVDDSTKHPPGLQPKIIGRAIASIGFQVEDVIAKLTQAGTKKPEQSSAAMVERHLRPSLSHVPGSYRSEILPIPAPERETFATTETYTPTSTSPKETIEEPRVRNVLSDASLRAHAYSPSRLSGGSRSTARHALLRASVTDAKPLDMGLPAPAALSNNVSLTNGTFSPHSSHAANDSLEGPSVSLTVLQSAAQGPLLVANASLEEAVDDQPVPHHIARDHAMDSATFVRLPQLDSGFGESVGARTENQELGMLRPAAQPTEQATSEAVDQLFLSGPATVIVDRIFQSAGLPAIRRSTTLSEQSGKKTFPLSRRATNNSMNVEDGRLGAPARQPTNSSNRSLPLAGRNDRVHADLDDLDDSTADGFGEEWKWNSKRAVTRVQTLEAAVQIVLPPSAPDSTSSSRQGSVAVLVQNTADAHSSNYTSSQYSYESPSRHSATGNLVVGQVPVNFASYEKLAQISSDSLSAVDEREPVNLIKRSEDSPGPQWSRDLSWRPLTMARVGTSVYTAIPARQSSFRSTEPTSAGQSHRKPTISLLEIEPKGQDQRQLPPESFMRRASRALRVNSSDDSAQLALLPATGQSTNSDVPAASTEGEILPRPRPSSARIQRPARQGTLDWLRDMIAARQSEGPRLTVLPPRPHREVAFSPEKPPSGAEVATEASRTNEVQRLAFENFSKTIGDLENLLSEALLVAREASERDDPDYLPGLLESATAVLQNGRTGQADDRETKPPKVNMQSAVPRAGQLGVRSSSLSSNHESTRRFSIGSDSSSSSISRTHHPDSDFYVQEDEDEDVPQQNLFGRRSTITPSESASMVGVRQHNARGSLIRQSHVNAALREHNAVKLGSYNDLVTIPLGPNTGRAARPGTELMSGIARAKENKEPFMGVSTGGSLGMPSVHNTHVLHKQPMRATSSATRPVTVIRPAPTANELPDKREVREFIRVFHQPPIHPRQSSLPLRKHSTLAARAGGISSGINLVHDMDHLTLTSSDGQHDAHDVIETEGYANDVPETEIDFGPTPGLRNRAAGTDGHGFDGEAYEMRDLNGPLPRKDFAGRRIRPTLEPLSLSGRSHVSLKEHRHFSLTRSHRRQPIARDWSPFRKRWVATVACISTALIGILIGIYAGEVPSIQYYIADFHHYAILGNVFFFIGLAIPTLVSWPLPLLHGRKPYTLAAMTIAMPLLFPQAVSVSVQRSPYTRQWRVGLLLPRAIMGVALGFANINFKSTLLDLFGSSLQSGNPHQEVVDEYDVRRHGGGMGIWLGIWTWCFVGSIGIGFMIGAVIINTLSPSWGFYISIIIIATVLLLNVLTPEVRRSAYRRSVGEVRTGNAVSRRLARGEVMMHRLGTGPTWWYQEFYQGILLSLQMLRQPGFLVLALYVAWIYGQVVLIIVVRMSRNRTLHYTDILQLVGSLTSKYYRFKSPYVGASVTAVPLGALLAVPFQKANLFSRARHHPQRTDSMTFAKRVTWSSHLVRRAIFTLVLPFAGLAYTLSSHGPPTPWILPILFAALIGFLSNLAIAECHGIIMEAFDTSDLQPGMTGRPRGKSGDKTAHKRTNYSAFPRVSSAFSITQGFGFLIGAGVTGVGGVAQRHLGQQAATGVMAAILLLLTLLLLCVLIRWKEVQIIPDSRAGEMDRWTAVRRVSTVKAQEAQRAGANNDGAVEEARKAAEEEEEWRPVIIGNPSGKTRRMSILELGSMTRWSEIRRRNRLIDEHSLEDRHPNLAALGSAREEIEGRVAGHFESFRGRAGVKKSGDEWENTSGSTVDGRAGAAGNNAGRGKRTKGKERVL